MMRDGPIPVFVHGVVEYVAGVALIVLPLLIDYESGTATAVSVVLGIIVLVIAATTAGPTGLIPQIPLPAHVALDYVLAALLIASPFIFSFSGEGAPTAIFIALGIAHLLITIGTRFSPAASPPAPAAKRASTPGRRSTLPVSPSGDAPSPPDAVPGLTNRGWRVRLPPRALYSRQ